MSLRRQYLLSVLLALAVSLLAQCAVAGWQARISVQNEMRKAVTTSDRIITNALASLPASGSDAYLARLVASFDGDRHLSVAYMEQGLARAVSRIAPPEPVPGWFARLLAIPTDTRRVSLPGGRYLLVNTDPHNEISETWGQLRDGSLILLLFSLVLLGLLDLMMVRTTRPLKTLSAGFDAVGGGDYEARVDTEGPTELAHLGKAFNRMAGRLGALESANQRLNSQMLTVQEEERADLARDLHDEMGPFLFTVRLEAESIEALAEKSSPIGRRARSIGDAVTHIQNHVRLILKQLRPDTMIEVSLAQAVENLAVFWQRHHGGIAIDLDIAPARQGFGVEMDQAIFRLVQEGLTNAVRHGNASRIWIVIAANDQAVEVRVEDNGIGLSDQRAVHDRPMREGMGLKGMRERLTPLSGQFALRPRQGGGTRLTAEFPRTRAQETA